MSKNRDLLGSLFWIAIGVFFVVNAIGYGLFSEGVPDPGFLPFLGGIILISLSMLDIILTSRQLSEGSTSDKQPLQIGSVKKTCFALLSLVVFTATVSYLGFLVTTFLILILLLKTIHPLRWSFVLIASILTTLGSYLVFHILLKLQFPKGILGI